jgi:hypothetical protein
MKRWRTLFGRLPGGHRPPTGPLTTKEAGDAEKLRQKTALKNDATRAHEQTDARDREP